MTKSETDKLREEIEQLRTAAVARYKAPSMPLRRVIEITDVPEFTIRNWLSRGQLELTADKAREPGRTRMFSARDAVIIALAGRLTRHGISITNCIGLMADFVRDVDDMVAGREGLKRVHLISLHGECGYTHRSLWANEPFDLSSIPPTCTVFQALRIAEETLGRLGWETPLDEQQSKSLAEDADQGSDDA